MRKRSGSIQHKEPTAQCPDQPHPASAIKTTAYTPLQRTTTHSNSKETSDHCKETSPGSLIEENDLLHEAIRARDREIRQLRSYLHQYTHQDEQK